MNSIPEDKFLQFNPDTMTYLRKLYNYDKPGAMDQAIDLLDDWIKKQKHFNKKDYSRPYLERVIIFLKGSVERAKSHVEAICTLRTILPKYFERHRSRDDYMALNNYYKQALLPKLTKDHYRVYTAKVSVTADCPKKFFEAYVFFTMLCEYMQTYDYCNGFIAVMDYRDIKIMDLVAALNFIEMNELVSIATKGYGFRLKAVHILTQSKRTETFIGMLKKILGSKVGNRIYVHTKVDTLHGYLPKEILPEELGGSEKCLDTLSQEIIDILSTEEYMEYTKELSGAVVNDSYKIKDKFKDMELAGTFRTLDVD